MSFWPTPAKAGEGESGIQDTKSLVSRFRGKDGRRTFWRKGQ